MTQPNTRLADELRRGGIALLAEAVADLYDTLLVEQGITRPCDREASGRSWLIEMHSRVAAIPPGNVAQPEAVQRLKEDYADLAATHEAVCAARDTLTARVQKLDQSVDELQGMIDAEHALNERQGAVVDAARDLAGCHWRIDFILAVNEALSALDKPAAAKDPT